MLRDEAISAGIKVIDSKVTAGIRGYQFRRITRAIFVGQDIDSAQYCAGCSVGDTPFDGTLFGRRLSGSLREKR